jgi:hypothetical protein
MDAKMGIGQFCVLLLAWGWLFLLEKDLMWLYEELYRLANDRSN